ncbi:MAG: TRAP transporter small permease subunit [Chitinophagales bacterium]|nr:TRAP transporter small permease subunit [Hyphomicrobiales bacterium]
MQTLLRFTQGVDWLTEQIGQALKWLVLAATLVCAGNALYRYGFSNSSNAWLEVQWYMFGAMFLLGAGYALKHEEHVRVDIFFSRLTPQQQAWVDVIGGVLFLMPVAILIAWLSIPMVINSYNIHEMSSDAGGLLRWPVKLLIPLGFGLLALQGVSEIIKKLAIARGVIQPGKAYEKPVQ